jgi:hypothetical protein
MRFSNEVSPVGGAYGTAVGGWSASPPNAMAEQVFGVFRNSYTKTATITAASFVRGAPVILTAASASNNGYDVINADTAGQVTNELFVGCVADYPDTTLGKTGVWQPEDFGIVQVYGLCTNAVLNIGTVSMAAALLLVPNTLSALATVANLTIPTGSGTGDTGAARTGIAGLAILYQTVASSSAAGTVAGKAWLRCM